MANSSSFRLAGTRLLMFIFSASASLQPYIFSSHRIPGQDVALHILQRYSIARVVHYHGQAAHGLGFLQNLPCPLHLGNISKGNHRSLNNIFKGAIGPDAQQVPCTLLGLDFNIFRCQSVQNLLYVLYQAVITQRFETICPTGRPTSVGIRLITCVTEE